LTTGGPPEATLEAVPCSGARPSSERNLEHGADARDTGGRELRKRIGIVLQETGHNPDLTVRGTVRQFAGYYRRPRPTDEVVGLVGLEEAADRRVRALSGGQRRRLDVGLALVGDPELVFLDEPTTGFDPAAAQRTTQIQFILPAEAAPAELPRVSGGVATRGRNVEISTDDPTGDLLALTGWAAGRGAALDGLTVTRPSLEDIYLTLTSDTE
jgi:ABC-2 type transport system ATP-binding protein